MNRSTWGLAAGLALAIVSPGVADEPAGAAKKAGVEIHSAPGAKEVRERVMAWVESKGAQQDEERLRKIGELWGLTEEPGARDLLDRVVETFAIADPATRQFVEQCAPTSATLLPPDPAPLLAQEADPFYVQNLRLFHARHLTQRQMYDEALEVFGEADLKQVVDPASALFYKGVCEHQLLKKDDGIKTLTNLLENTEQVPAPYASVAELMRHELQNLQEESLDEVARMMRDVERRLDLGRGGQKVQKQEERVVAKLDKIIEKLEQQMGGGGGGGGNANNSNQSSGPLQDSQVKGATAPGNVDQKKYTQTGAWGNLPEKEEARVKQMIGKNFPPHYQQLIEEVTKKNASRRAAAPRGGE